MAGPIIRIVSYDKRPILQRVIKIGACHVFAPSTKQEGCNCPEHVHASEYYVDTIKIKKHKTC